MSLTHRIDSAIGTLRSREESVEVLVKPPKNGPAAQPETRTYTGYMPVRRILYFQSQMDDIIDWAIENSGKLRRLLGDLPRIKKDENDVITPGTLRRKSKYQDFSSYLSSNGALKSATYESSDGTPISWRKGIYEPPILFLKDFHIYGSSETQGMILSGFLRNPAFEYSVLLVSSPLALIPQGFEDRVELISAPQIDQEDIAALIEKAFRQKNEKRDEKKPGLSPEHEKDDRLLEVARRFKGLSRRQVEDVLHRVYIACRRVCELESDLSAEQREAVRRITDNFIWETKKSNSLKDGSLIYLDTEQSARAVGMDGYINWIRAHVESFSRRYPDAPRGVTFVGIPGTGKTLMARYTAQLLGCELVRFDLGMVKNSLYGASGQNLDAKLDLFDAQAPLVVLIDEAEKHLPSTRNNDVHETTASLMGRFLTWMNDHTSPVFLMFTSNDISKTNEELFRPGRIDRVFFVGMPWRDELAAILQSNLINEQREWAKHGLSFILSDQMEALQVCQKAETPQTHAACTAIVDALADLIETQKRDLFFTGADIAQLVKEASSHLAAQGKQMPFDLKALQGAMCAVAVGRPFATGERSMSTIRRLYLQCAQDNYALVSECSHLFDAASCLLHGEEIKRPELDNAYDRALYSRIVEEMIREMESVKKRAEALNLPPNPNSFT